MNELDFLTPGHRGDFAPLGTLRWLTETADRVTEEMPLTNAQREHLLQIAVERLRQQTGATGAAVALEQFGEMVCRASSGDTAPDVGTPLRLEGSFTARCIQSGAALRCDDSDSDPRVNAEACRALGTRSMLVVPVRAHERIMGVLEILSDQPRAFTNAHQAILEAVATVIGEAFDNFSSPGTLDEMPEQEPLIYAAPPAIAPLPEKPMFDDGTWGESVEFEEAPEIRLFSGLHIRHPEVRKFQIVAFAAITFAACAGALILSRQPRPSHTTKVPNLANSVASAAAQPTLQSYNSVASGAAVLPSKLTQTVQHEKNAKSASLLDPGAVTPSPVSGTAVRPAASRVAPPKNPPVARAQIISEPIFRVDPVYPKQAIERHMEGTVVLSALVDKQGRVQMVSIVSGDPIFRAPALNAVKNWRYSPTVINGQPIEAETQVTLAFTLEH